MLLIIHRHLQVWASSDGWLTENFTLTENLCSHLYDPQGEGVLLEKLSGGVWPASQHTYPIWDQNLEPNIIISSLNIWYHILRADPYINILLQTWPLRSYPSIALRIPTAHNFTRDQRARIRKWRLFLWLDLAKVVNRHFLEKRLWWPIIFFCCFELSSKFLNVK